MKVKNKTKNIYLVLDNVRSNFNVGSIFRIADCVGVTKIFLGGYTPSPIDRFGRENKEIKKVALGGENSIPFEKVFSVSRLVKKLKEDGYEIVSLEQSSDSFDYKKYKIKNNTALIVGNEVKGVSKKILELSNKKIEIPMKGDKESLNVAVATAVALFRVLEI